MKDSVLIEQCSNDSERVGLLCVCQAWAQPRLECRLEKEVPTQMSSLSLKY